jgi:hypothetical protein
MERDRFGLVREEGSIGDTAANRTEAAVCKDNAQEPTHQLLGTQIFEGTGQAGGRPLACKFQGPPVGPPSALFARNSEQRKRFRRCRQSPDRYRGLDGIWHQEVFDDAAEVLVRVVESIGIEPCCT